MSGYFRQLKAEICEVLHPEVMAEIIIGFSGSMIILLSFLGFMYMAQTVLR